jgi:cytochrome d ubiquinol oxidase subunit II
MELALFFYFLLGFAVLMYVILDGFDLGLGILYPWFETSEQRDTVMRSIAHVWDGNETWLIFAGVTLFAAFPLAYAQLLSHLYIPIMLMLFGLIFRGVSFEYRHRAERSKLWWDRAFFVGSALAAFSQGMILGALVQGAKVNGEGFELVWLTPFTLLVGLSVVAGYALLGSTYLIIKTRLPLAQQAARLGKTLLLIVVGALVMVSLLMVFANEPVFARWFNTYHLIWLAPLPILSAILAWKLYQNLDNIQSLPRPQQPFWLAVGLFISAFAGLLISLYPYLIPFQLTLWQAQAPHSALAFVLPGVLIFLPLVLGYTLWGYKIFAGKLEHDTY